ncbi:hypothetical protein [Paraburkholderia sp. BCC1884]|uniref:hypothetical protein n=1 Tax=Paraburkholderia sp. BCC1884 TaxID=2562668 RepID=UPI001183AFC6|nr:hypothetical protein [Paraburkholderia sp. BCC1884]
MQIKKTSALTGVSLASIGLLSGCVQFVSVKDMARDKPGYLATHFTIESLPAGVRDKLPAAGAHTLPFKMLTMSGTLTGHVGAVAIKSDFKATLINAQDTGLVQQVFETSANDVPSGATFSLSYLNMYSLKQETASYSQTTALIPFIVHDSDNNQFAFDAPKEDTTYTTTFKIGTTVQLVNFRTTVSSCHTGRYYPASQMSAGLTGRAIDLDCQDTRDGIIQNKTRRTYLTEYGVGLSRSLATSTAKMDWSYSDFQKDGEKTAIRFATPASDKPI